MSEQAIDTAAIRRALRDYIETHADPGRAETVNEVAAANDWHGDVVRRQLETMIEAGFAYPVSREDEEVLRVP